MMFDHRIVKRQANGFDQTGLTHRLIRGFVGRTYRIVGNPMSWLIFVRTLKPAFLSLVW